VYANKAKKKKKKKKQQQQTSAEAPEDDDASKAKDDKPHRLIREDTRFGDLGNGSLELDNVSTDPGSSSDEDQGGGASTTAKLLKALKAQYEKLEKPTRVGQKLPADEQWPAWRAPIPTLPTGADHETLIDDQRYFDQFGAYLSETMFAATKDVVAEIRVQDTLSRHVKRIPIRRLVAEPLVSSWFAKWVATVILKNRALAGKTWHRIEIVQNIANQLEECRGFFRNPEQYGASTEMYSTAPVGGRARTPFRSQAQESSSSSDDDDA
jgi:hypothetical protein